MTSKSHKQHDSKNIQLIEDEMSFDKLKSTWDNLLEMGRSDSIFLSHGYLKSFLESWRDDKELKILLVYDKDHLAGAMPLMISKGRYLGLPVNILSFIENDETPHCGLLINPKYNTDRILYPCLDYLFSIKKNWNFMALRKIPSESGFIRAIQTYCQRHKYSCLLKKTMASPILEVDAEWEAFLATKSQRFKKRVRYNKNRLQRKGQYSIQETENIEEIISLIQDVYTLDAKSWKGRHGLDIGGNYERRLFFSKLPLGLGPKGKVRLWVLKIKGQIIAYEYHVVHGATAYSLRAGFDESYRDCSPGAVLDYEIIKSLFTEKISTYNMCGSSDEYKLRWTSETKEHVNLLIYNNRPVSYFLSVLEIRMKKHLKKLLGRQPNQH